MSAKMTPELVQELIDAARAYADAVPEWVSFSLKGGNAKFQELDNALRRILARIDSAE